MSPEYEALGLEIDKTFYLSLLNELREIEDELSDFEVKQLIFKCLSLVPGISVEWGDSEQFGPTTLLLRKQNTLLVIEASPLVYTIRILWNDYQRTLQTRLIA